MKKAITIQDIINGIEYITIIDGKESKPSYGAIWSTWKQNITKESEKFFGYKPEKEFDPIARENYQKYIAMAYYAGQIPAKIIETRTNEIGEDGCYIFTVETFGSLKLDEEAEEDGAKETETEAEPAHDSTQHTTAPSTRQHPAHDSTQHTTAASTRQPPAHDSRQHTTAASTRQPPAASTNLHKNNPLYLCNISIKNTCISGRCVVQYRQLREVTQKQAFPKAKRQ